MSNFIDINEKVLQVKNLKKYFRVGSGRRKLLVPAVDGVTFDIFKKEVFGVVGESGSGKTTLGRTIIKLYQPTDGDVILNGVKISAGSMGYKEEINSLKSKLKDDIDSLNPSKIKAISLRDAAKNEINAFKAEKQQLLKDKVLELAKINKDFDQFRADRYHLKALFQIELNAINFEFNQKVMETKRQTQNDALLRYKNEVKIEEKKLQNKLKGLRESAALDESTIQQRMENLKAASKSHLDSLEKKYKPLIEEEKKKILSKAKASAIITSLVKTKNQKIAVVTNKFKEKLNNILSPNKQKFTIEKKKIDQKYEQNLKNIDRKISLIKIKLTNDIAKLPKVSINKDANNLKRVKELKLQTRERIRELKKLIQETQRVNSANDTLKESQKMQMIFQDPISSLNPRMTVREIIGEGLIIENKLSKKEIAKKVEDALVLVGLSPEYASRYPHEFSGGQRQRIGVARALIMNPNVIIADEPISSLDVSIRAQIINLLFSLREKLGLTVLFIAHDLSVVRFFCDRIAVMFNGKVVELAPSEELFENPLHPYTVSLLSAIPQPDPDYEKNRKRIQYNPRQHDYRHDKPSLKEISPGHFVFANQEEFIQLQQKVSRNRKDN